MALALLASQAKARPLHTLGAPNLFALRGGGN